MQTQMHQLFQITKDLWLQFRRNATVATRDPTDPPNMNVGYVRTWLRYLSWEAASLHPSWSWLTPILLWLKFSTSCTNSSFVLLHDVITYQWCPAQSESGGVKTNKNKNFTTRKNDGTNFRISSNFRMHLKVHFGHRKIA